MVSFSMDTRGITKTLKSLKNKSEKLTTEMHKIHEESVKNMYHRARAMARIDTGAMRAHVKIKIVKKSRTQIIIIIFDDVLNKQGVNYAKFIEFGTKKMRAYPFLFPAMEYERPVIRSRLRRMIKKL